MKGHEYKKQEHECNMKEINATSKWTGRTEGCPGMVVWTSVGGSFLCAGAVFYDSGTSVG